MPETVTRPERKPPCFPPATIWPAWPFCHAKDAAALEAAGFQTAARLLDHLPKRYEDRRRFDPFPTQPTPAAVCLRGTVVDSSKRRFGRGRGFYEAVVMDGSGGVFGSGKITCRWFNMPFIHKLVATGQEVVVYGKVKDSKRPPDHRPSGIRGPARG